VKVASVADALDQLAPDDLDHLGHVLLDRARRRRTRLTEEQAWAAWQAAPLTTDWAASVLVDVGRVRIATRLLIDQWGYSPQRVAEAMLPVALHVCPDAGIAELAVAAGLADARGFR